MSNISTLADLVTTWQLREGAPALQFWDNAPGASAARAAGPLPFTYPDLAHRVAMCASALSAKGLAPGDRVAWLGYNQPDIIVLLVALGQLGAMLVPLNHRLAPEEWRAVLQDCQPRWLLHDTHWGDGAAGLRSHDLDVVAAADFTRAGAVHRLPAHSVGPDTPALLVYTSGTTGRPKGAVHTHRMLLANMHIAATVQAMTAADRVLTVLPLFHVGGLCIQTLPALYAGARVDLLARFDADDCLQHIPQEQPSLTLQVPATMKALTEHPAWAHTRLDSLRAVWAGSSVLPDRLVEAFHARGVPVCNVYGATETGPFSVALAPDQALSHVGSCGWPAPGVQVRLLDVPERGTGVGELAVRGPNVVRHYWPDVVAQDSEGFFHTGDLARQAADGSYWVVGRAKDMIISGGENIYPAEIEQVLACHPDILEAAVIGVPDPQWGEVAVAVLVGRPGVRPDEPGLRALLGSRLARYKHPKKLVWLDSLPKTALGKVQKNELARLLGNELPD